jgi:hypothetical protein
VRNYERETPIQEFALAEGKRYGWESHKMVSESKRGYPDCQFTRKHPTILNAMIGKLIETKATGEEARLQQKKRHAELRAAGWEVLVSDDRREISAFLSRL